MTGYHFVPASLRRNSNQLNFMQQVAGTKFCSRNRTFSRKNGDVTREKLSLQHVPAICPLVCAGLNKRKTFAGKNVH